MIRPTFLLRQLILLGTIGAILAGGPPMAQAALMSVSTTAPTVDGADIAQLVGGQTANNDYTAIWYDRPRQGQSFTTATSAWIYQLQAITLKHNYSPTNWTTTGPWTIRIGVLDASNNLTVLHTETATGVNLGGNVVYTTWTLNTPMRLRPNLVYAFDVFSSGNGMVTENSLAGSSPYPGGTAISSGGTRGGNPIFPDNPQTVSNFDRVFHLDMTSVYALDLGDMIGGGNGRGTGSFGVGIRPDTGGTVAAGVFGGNHPNVGGTFVAFPGSPYIDGLFVPDQNTKITTTNLTYAFPDTDGNHWDAVRNGVSVLESNGLIRPLRLADGNITTFGIGLHANAGITFDLQAIRASLLPAESITSLVAVAGGRDGSQTPVGYVLFDGVLKWSGTLGRGTALNLAIPDTVRFLPLASTDGGNGYSNDKAYFAEAFLMLSVPEPAAWQLLALALSGLLLAGWRRLWGR
ncbi:MAG: hypothetical protein RMI90_09835 [Thermoguttaceae bacterium]|nr:hypothetical protein [Thermoguttaceae bacterium]